MALGSVCCPNCGHDAIGGVYVCQDCGKVFCSFCDERGKNPFHGNNCPRCASCNYVEVHDFREIGHALRNSQN